MKKKLCAFLVLLFPALCWSQDFSVTLSGRHAEKLNRCKTEHARLIRYYRFYKRDSVRQTRRLLKKEKVRIFRDLMADHRINPIDTGTFRLTQKLNAKPLEMADSISDRHSSWHSIFRDSLHRDSLKRVAIEKLEQTSDDAMGGLLYDFGPIAHYPSLSQMSPLSKEVAPLKDIAGIPLENAGPPRSPDARSFPGFDDVPGQFRASVPADSLKRAAVRMMSDHLQRDVALIAARKKAVKHISRFRSFSSLDDFSSGKKRNALEGKTFGERLVIGGSFNVVSTQPFSADIMPRIGYKITAFFHLGGSVTYRYTQHDSLQFPRYVSGEHVSYRVFASHELTRNYFGYMEWEKTFLKSKTEISRQGWRDNAFVGVGRKMLVHPHVYLRVTALYNLNSEENNPLYYRRFQIRIGFDLSELATRKRVVQYDPNRFR